LDCSVILENGVIRTLDPSLPKAGALAIAGELVAGGVGTHETALASPERVDLGGRCVLPGFTDAHVHFPTWALAQRQVRLEGSSSLDEALARVGDAVGSVPEGRWLRGLGWRSGDWSPAVEPTKEALDAVTGDVPAALMARDYHSLWLNSAALARANGDLQVPGGVVERDEQGEPTGVLREECAWHFRDLYVRPTHEEMVDASREGIRLANSRGVVAIHDKDGWLGALAVFQELQREGALTLRVWQSLPHGHVDQLAEIGISAGLGDAFLRVGYIKAFMDGTLGSQTARMLDGSGVEISTGSEIAVSPGLSAESGLGGVMPNRVLTDSSPRGASTSVPTTAGLAGMRAVRTSDVAFSSAWRCSRLMSSGDVVRMSTAAEVSALMSLLLNRSSDAVASTTWSSRRSSTV